MGRQRNITGCIVVRVHAVHARIPPENGPPRYIPSRSMDWTLNLKIITYKLSGFRVGIKILLRPMSMLAVCDFWNFDHILAL